MAPTLYDILGVSAHASDEELRWAYYRAARRLHPDVNPDLDSDAMRQLNQAWAVLGEPASRHAYDRTLLDGATGRDPAPRGAEAGTGRPLDGTGDPGIPPLARMLRPSVVIIAVLLVIFLVTAYAGPGPADRTAPSAPTVAATPTPTTTPAPPAGTGTGTAGGVPIGVVASGTSVARLVGQCLQILPSYVAVVPCTTANDGRVMAGAVSVDQCPAGARAYRLPGQGQIVCLEPAGA